MCMKKKSNGRMPKGGRGSKKPLSLNRLSDEIVRLRKRVDALERRLRDVESHSSELVRYS